MKIIKKDEFVEFDVIKEDNDMLGFNKLWNEKGEGIYCVNFGSRCDVELYFVENLSNELEDIFEIIKSNLEIMLEEGDEYLIKYIKESVSENNFSGLFEFLGFVNEIENDEGKLYMDLSISEEDIRNYYIIKE